MQQTNFAPGDWVYINEQKTNPNAAIYVLYYTQYKPGIDNLQPEPIPVKLVLNRIAGDPLVITDGKDLCKHTAYFSYFKVEWISNSPIPYLHELQHAYELKTGRKLDVSLW